MYPGHQKMKFEDFLAAKKAAAVAVDMNEIKALLHEVVGALMCEDIELRALTRDIVLSYLEKIK